MANTRIGIDVPTKTNITRGMNLILKVGPYLTDGTVEPCQAVSLNTDEKTWVQTAAGPTDQTLYPAGILEYDLSVNWDTTTPAMTTAYPAGLYVHAIAHGPCLCQVDKSQITTNTERVGSIMCVTAAGIVGSTYAQDDCAIGFLLDELPPNTADGDLSEIFVHLTGRRAAHS